MKKSLSIIEELNTKDTFAKLIGDYKQMLTFRGAIHCNLYDQIDIIPFDEIIAFS